MIADENGPRISGSPAYRRAANLAVKAYNDAGIKQADLESWGVFGRGWDWSRVAVQMKLPYASTLSAYPADFSPGTDAPVTGSVVFAPIWDKGEEPENGDLEKLAHQIESWKDKYRGQLRGKIVMLDHPVPFELSEQLEVFRFDEDDLNDMGHSVMPSRWTRDRFQQSNGQWSSTRWTKTSVHASGRFIPWSSPPTVGSCR